MDGRPRICNEFAERRGTLNNSPFGMCLAHRQMQPNKIWLYAGNSEYLFVPLQSSVVRENRKVRTISREGLYIEK